jgi:hydroxylamine reductase
LFGIKGASAYMHHAVVIGVDDDSLYNELQYCVFKLTTKMTFDESVQHALRTGEMCYKVMELLDKANTQAYGVPEPTKVRMTPIKGKCILVSGHDLKDLEEVLAQSKDKGVNVYTHGEMLPCNAYPKLKQYKHLVGHYGGPWQLQKGEFSKFPGSILMTTNCIMEPMKSYAGRIFTSAAVGWTGVKHVQKGNMIPLIEEALKQPGFKEDAPKRELTIGFCHKTVLSMAPIIIEAIKAGAIKHFFVIGGCDGTESERSYFTELTKAIPKDCIILTCGCGKYRVNCVDLGEIDFKGTKIPRLLDTGQCNDAFSAVQIAVALSKAFNCGVNDLPLSLVISWFEQKAVCVFLALLHLGIKNMILGPRLPAFLTPKLLNLLVEKFKVRPIGTVEEDLKFCLSKKT